MPSPDDCRGWDGWLDAHFPHVPAAVAADSGCRGCTLGVIPVESSGVALGAQLCSHSVACGMLWVTENEEFTLSWLRQQQTLPGAVSHSAAGVCFLQFFPSPCFNLTVSSCLLCLIPLLCLLTVDQAAQVQA